MMTRKARRLWIVVVCGLFASTATALMLVAFRSSLSYFLSPQEVLVKHPRPGEIFRLGGVVQVGTVVMSHRDGKPLTRFRITDGQASIPVVFTGILPDLFRQGQGVVTIGSMTRHGEVFRADTVLAKHGASYMPADVEQALRASGKWNPKFGPAPNAATWDDKTPQQIAAAKG